MKVKASIVNAAMVIMGLLGIAVLLLPWYELTSSTYISGFGSSHFDGGEQMGLVAAGTSLFGYGLYLLPIVAISMGINKAGAQIATRAKALILEFIGLAEIVCLLLMNSQMGSFGTSISGDGFSGSAGFDPLSGYYIAFGVYVLTGAAGLVMMLVAPKPQDEAKAQAPKDEIPQ